MPYLNHEDFKSVDYALRVCAAALSPPNNDVERLATKALAAAIMATDSAKSLVADQPLRDIAEAMWGSDDLEIDDEGVGISPANGGRWVQAWVWVPHDAGKEE